MEQCILSGSPVRNWNLAKANLEKEASVEKKSGIAISFLICCYNGEKYIKRCLDSIFGQKGFSSDCEVIIVNDGSTDSTLKILEEYQILRPELKIVTNPENMGLLYARRRAAVNASGEYIHFVDIDDALTADCLSVFREVTSEKKEDIFRFNITFVDTDYKEISDYSARDQFNRDKNETFSGKDVFEDFFLNKYFPAITVHWIKKSCVEESFACIPAELYCTMAEDVYQVTLFSYFAQSKRILSDRYLYLYTIGSGCSTNFQDVTFQKSERAIYSVYTVMKGIQHFLKEKNLLEEYKDIYISFCKKYIAGNIYSKIFPLNEKERQTLLALLFHWGIDNLTLQGIAKDLHGYEDSLGACVSRNMFPKSIKPIRTIALYYHRIGNGGVERLMAKLADFFVTIGYKAVLLLDEEPKDDAYAFSDKVVCRTFASKYYGDRTPEKLVQRVAEWKKIIEEEQIDLVLDNAWSQPKIIWDFLAVKTAGCKFMCYVHGSCSVDLDWTSIARRIFAGVDGLICLSRVDEIYFQQLGFNAYYLPNMVTIDFPEINDFSPLNHDVVWVGRFHREKQPMDAVKAFALIHKKVPDARLIFVGKGEEGDTIEDELKAAVKAYGIEKNVVFAGYTTNVAEYLKRAAAFLFTSKFEGFSLVISEAKACGLPIIGYDLPYMETFRTCEGHILVGQGDYQALAEETVKILQNPALREELARKAYESIKYFQNYPYEQKWKEVFSVIEKCDLFKPQENAFENLSIAVRIIAPSYDEAIRKVEKKLSDFQGNINELWGLCLEKDSALLQRDTALQQKENDLQQKENDLQKMDFALKAKVAQNTELAAELNRLSYLLEFKNSEILRLNGLFYESLEREKKLGQTIKEQWELCQEKDSALQTQQSMIQEKDAWLHRLRIFRKMMVLMDRVLPPGSIRGKIVKAPFKITKKCLKLLCGKR